MRVTLPDHLAAALNRWHTQPECDRLVKQFELYGVDVAVIRLQLGDWHAPGFGYTQEIHNTRRRKDR